MDTDKHGFKKDLSDLIYLSYYLCPSVKICG